MLIMAIAAVVLTVAGLGIAGLIRLAGSHTPHWEIRHDTEVS